jgi:predicted ATPase/DNA-binding SARP family transcriptional activator/DNA-binding CsgD family transcriptional regulator
VAERPEALRVRLLGGFWVSVGSRSVEGEAWRLRKAAGLIKILSLAPQHRLPRERATQLLWPGSNPKTAANNLRGALHAARKALGPEGSEHLISDDGTLLLCPQGDLFVDAEAFEEAASTARRSRNPAAYRAAIDLYAGELLPGDPFEDWAEEGRADLRRLYLDLLTELAGLHEERGEHDRAFEALQNVVAEEPTDEGVHTSLMRLYALSGRQGEALSQYERLREVLSERLDAEPAAHTERLREEIAAGTFLPAPSAVGSPEITTGEVNHNLPAPTTSFVGREHDLVGVKRALAMTRLLTLTGPGGSGKTRLALEVAANLAGAYPDGVRLVELAPLSEPGLVVGEVAGTLGVQERPGEPLLDVLADALRTRRMLLVLDNCEHLIDAVARLVGDLLRVCPDLRLLATSREALGVSGEVNLPVPPLSLPDPGRQTTAEELEGYESARLFIERALYRPTAFALTPENAGAVAEVCRQLEGIPLAIELAAARVGVLAVEQISERLSDSLALLTGGGRTLSSRQRTLRGSLDWSYRLLDDPEKRLFGRLAVFAGDWSLEAAEAVCPGEGIGHGDVLDLLGGLVDKSLVMVGATAGGVTRYRMLEPIRQYARMKLEESGEADEMRIRHAAFFLALAEEAEPELVGPTKDLWMARLATEHDNLRAALSWTLQREEGEVGLRFGAALWRFWHERGHLSEGGRWVERVLAGGPEATPARVRALEGMGWNLQYRGDLDRADETYSEMLDLSRELDDKGNVATALNSLAILAVTRGDNERAGALLEENLSVLGEMEESGAATTRKRFFVSNLLGILAINEERNYAKGIALLEDSLTLAREAGDTYNVGTTLCNLGYATVLLGDYQRAATLSEGSLKIARELANAEMIPENLVNLGLAMLGQGDHERAASSLREALSRSQNAGRKATIINSLEAMASLAGTTGDDIRAAVLWGAAQTSRQDTGIALPPGERAFHEPYLASSRSRLGETAWEEAVAGGSAMSLEGATEYALSVGADPHGAPSMPEKPTADEPSSNLTQRELEVTTLVVQGLTNRQISTRLGISERTAGNHVGRILGKLGLRSRAQIATWAAERDPR